MITHALRGSLRFQARLRQAESGRELTMVSTMVSTDAELSEKVVHLESELSLKKLEVESLRDQVSQMKNLDAGPASRTEINEKIVEVNSLRLELEKTKKDKNITSGLVTQMQRDMTSKVSFRFTCLNFTYFLCSCAEVSPIFWRMLMLSFCLFAQDTTISRLTRELENLKKECADKSTMLVSMQSKVNVCSRFLSKRFRHVRQSDDSCWCHSYTV